MTSATTPEARNPVGATLQLVGDRWTLLILRESFRGARRFVDFEQRLAISPSVLSRRLGNLADDDLLAKVRYSDSPPRDEYRLTEAARDLWPVFVAVWAWNRTWLPRSAWLEQAELVHDVCRNVVTAPLLADAACDAVGVTARDTTTRQPDDLGFGEANPPRRYRRTSQAADDAGDEDAVMDASALLGDRWSTAVLAASFLGSQRFADYETRIEGIPPLQLSDRLATFERQDVLRRVPVEPGGRRHRYELTAKGLAFFSIFATLLAWGAHWRAGDDGRTVTIMHRPCGNPLQPRWTCNACGQRLHRREIHFAE